MLLSGCQSREPPTQKIVTFNFEDLLIYKNVYLKCRVQMAAAFVCPCAKIRVLDEGDKGGGFKNSGSHEISLLSAISSLFISRVSEGVTSPAADALFAPFPLCDRAICRRKCL